MDFVFEHKLSDSPLIDGIWRTEGMGGSFISVAEVNSGLVITKQRDNIMITIHGPETMAYPAPVPEDAEIFGIVLKLGTFMPHLPLNKLVDNPIILPEAGSHSFWLHGSAWEFPTYENIDTFIARLTREGLLVSDPVIDTVLNDQTPYLSSRTVQRRFLQATGLTYSTIQKIKRARLATSLLQQGKSIADTIFEAGYFDQPHLTRALKHFVGQTPAQILRSNQSE